MPDDDFDVVRRCWAAASRGDPAGMERELHPEVVAVPFGAAMEGKAYRGPAEVMGWWRDEIMASWEFFQVLPETFERVGKRLLVTGRWNARGIESGVELDIRASWIVEVRDGKIAYWQTYTDHAQARRDAGMSPGNVDLIRPIYEEWGRGSWRPSFEIYHPRMEWGWSDDFPGLAGVYEDHADPNPRLQAWLSEWEDWRAEAEEFLEFGDHVVVLASYRGRGRGSGVEINQLGAHVFELRDGEVIRLEIFADRAKAIESVHAARSEEPERTGPKHTAG